MEHKLLSVLLVFDYSLYPLNTLKLASEHSGFPVVFSSALSLCCSLDTVYSFNHFSSYYVDLTPANVLNPHYTRLLIQWRMNHFT